LMMTNRFAFVRGSEYPCPFEPGHDGQVWMLEPRRLFEMRQWCQDMTYQRNAEGDSRWVGQVTLTDRDYDGPCSFGSPRYTCRGQVHNGVFNFQLTAVGERDLPW
jgi:hypothetical protein